MVDMGTSQERGKIVTSGEVVSGPYVPQGTKRIGEVGEGKGFRRVSVPYSK